MHQQLHAANPQIQPACKAVVKKYPDFKDVKEPPMVTYLRPKNIMSHLAKSRYTNKFIPENIPQKESESFIGNCFNKSETINNTLSKRSAKIQGGYHTDQSVIYTVKYKNVS